MLPAAKGAVQPGRRHLDRVLVEIRPQHVRYARAERVVDAGGMIDEHTEPVLAGQLEREHLDVRERIHHEALDLALELPFLLKLRCCHPLSTPNHEKWAPRAHSETSEMLRAGYQNALLFGSTPGSSRLPPAVALHALEEDRDRPVVHERDGHPSAENAGLDVDPELSQSLGEALVE